VGEAMVKNGFDECLACRRDEGKYQEANFKGYWFHCINVCSFELDNAAIGH